MVNSYESFLLHIKTTESSLSKLVKNTDDQIDFDKTYPLSIKNSDIHGVGLFTDVPIIKNSIICPARVSAFRTPAGRYMNHSSRPNTYMEISGNKINVISSIDIRKDDELTTNYFLNNNLENTNKQEEKLCQEVKVHTARRLVGQKRKKRNNNQSPIRLFIESFTNY